MLSLLIFVTTLSLYGIWYDESKSKLTNFWTVKSIISKGQDITNEFEYKKIILRRDGRVRLPKHDSYQGSYLYGNWIYERTSLRNAKITIKDKNQNFFSGNYNIDIISQAKPQLLKLSSGDIEVYMEEVDWNDLLTKGVDLGLD